MAAPNCLYGAVIAVSIQPQTGVANNLLKGSTLMGPSKHPTGSREYPFNPRWLNVGLAAALC